MAGLIAGLVLAGHQLPCWGHEELLQLAASIEGQSIRRLHTLYCSQGERGRGIGAEAY